MTKKQILHCDCSIWHCEWNWNIFKELSLGFTTIFNL